jgi:hypothetical protein
MELTTKNKVVKLKQATYTLTNTFQKGDLCKILGEHGTCLRLSRVNDRAKLIVSPEMVEKVN